MEVSFHNGERVKLYIYEWVTTYVSGKLLTSAISGGIPRLIRI